MSDEPGIAPVDGPHTRVRELVQVPTYVGVELSLAGWFVGKTSTCANLFDEDPFGGPCVVRWWVAALYWRLCVAQRVLTYPLSGSERVEALRYIAAAKQMRGAAEAIGRLHCANDGQRTPEERRPCKHRGVHPLDGIVEAALTRTAVGNRA